MEEYFRDSRTWNTLIQLHAILLFSIKSQLTLIFIEKNKINLIKSIFSKYMPKLLQIVI